MHTNRIKITKGSIFPIKELKNMVNEKLIIMYQFFSILVNKKKDNPQHVNKKIIYNVLSIKKMLIKKS